MKTRHLISALVSITILLSISCSHTPEVSTISASPTIISEGIESSMPGELLVTDQYILWCDPFNTEINTHILDKESGTEIGQLVKKGNGPNEFNMPFTSIRSYDDNLILTYDPNSNKQITFSIDNSINKQEEITDI